MVEGGLAPPTPPPPPPSYSPSVYGPGIMTLQLRCTFDYILQKLIFTSTNHGLTALNRGSQQEMFCRKGDLKDF